MKTKFENIIYLLSLIGILVLFSLRFFLFDNHSVELMHYDFQKADTIDVDLPVAIDTFSYNFMRLTVKDTTGSFSKHFKTDYLYRLKTNNGDVYYFRFNYAMRNRNEINLHEMRWLNEVPFRLDSLSDITLMRVPLKQSGRISMMTIGDEWVYMNEGKYFRKLMAERFPVQFYGEHQDLFGYPMQADYRYSFDDLAAISRNMPAVEYYVLFADGNCHADEKKIMHIITNLHKKKPKKIIWIGLPTTGQKSDSCRQKINKILSRVHDSTFVFLSLDNEFSKGDKENFLAGSHKLSKKAYKKIVAKLVKYIR